jgi:hypothetical protein
VPTQINGLPAHILLVHAVIVLVPLAAVMVVLSALWPAARRKLGFLSPLAALGALAFVPVTTNAGEWLRDRLPNNPAIARHAELGGMMLPWAVGLFLVSAAVWWVGRRADEAARASASTQSGADTLAPASGSTATATALRPATTSTRSSWLVIAVAVVAVLVSAGSVVQLYRIGDSGSKAVWGGVIQSK